MRRVLLIRHPPVDDRFAGLCYGASDIPLSPAGVVQIEEIAARLANLRPTAVFHSGLARARQLAEALDPRATADARLRERDFGEWELQSWDAIHAATGDAMMGMVTHPNTWRPPGGETTFELRDRVWAWYRELPADGVIVAVTHGGPVAALRGALAGAPVPAWPALIPKHSEIVEIH